MEISDPKLSNPWRKILETPASFRGVMFHVENGSRTSGRRSVVHEYPKRADELGPYAEDMGKHAIRFSFSGYLIYRPNGRYDYVTQRQLLIRALEKEGPGQLIHPVFAQGGMLVQCERYSVSETRERGGFTTFEMQFVQAGAPGNTRLSEDTLGLVNQRAQAVTDQALAAWGARIAQELQVFG